jgi:hypothetical protein
MKQENPAPRDTTVAVLLLAPTASRCVRTYIHTLALLPSRASLRVCLLPAARRCLRCRSQRLWPRLPLMASRGLGLPVVWARPAYSWAQVVKRSEAWVGRGGWTSSSGLSPSISCSQAWSAHLQQQQQQRHFSANCCRSFQLFASGLLREINSCLCLILRKRILCNWIVVQGEYGSETLTFFSLKNSKTII